MNKQAVYHRAEVPYAYGVEEDVLYIKIRVAAFDAERITLIYRDRYGKDTVTKQIEMDYLQGNSMFDFYEARIQNTKKRFKYYFKVEGKDGETIFYNERGVLKEDPLTKQAFQFPYLCAGDWYQEVTWAQEGVVYQIFPDRFCNGDKSNDPEGVKPWGGAVSYRNFFGGDLRGIIEKLDYLKELGVTILYMTPIFESCSNHKYNIRDYYKIDPAFGTETELKELAAKAHDRGMRLILDGVFNHSGHDFFAFQDILKQGENSEYVDWYFVDDFPVSIEKVNYITFGDHHFAMPKLKMKNKAVRNYFIEAGRYWIRECGIDGWRLDVCDEIDHIFLKEFYQAVKTEKPDAFVVGEIMHSNGAFLRGDEIDATMNYPVTEAMLDFFAVHKISAKEFCDALAVRRHDCMEMINRQMFNLLDSHDTPRFLHAAGERTERLRLAVVFQYTYLGIPYIYYGDEIGMSGGDDPDCRRCMQWQEEKQSLSLQNHYKKMAQLRRENKELIYGSFNSELNGDSSFLYFRRIKEQDNIQETIVLINNHDTEKAEFALSPGIYQDLYQNCEIVVEKAFELKALSFAVLKKLQISEKEYC